MAKRISTLRTKEYFRERATRVNRQETLRILERAGKGNSPMVGDELPSDWEPDFGKKELTSKSLAGKNRGSRQRRKRKAQMIYKRD